jgi:hypothetical protein
MTTCGRRADRIGRARCERCCNNARVSPLVLALIDAVFGLAFHHDQRARDHSSPGSAISVRAVVSGPELGDPAPGGLAVRVFVAHSTGHQAVREESVGFHIDVRDGRLLALELELAELPLSRSGFARLIGELESWCYRRIPLIPARRA